MVTVVAVNIKRKTEIKMGSQSRVYDMKGKLVSCMCSLDCVVCVLAFVFYFLKWEELNWMQCTVKVNYDDMTSCMCWGYAVMQSVDIVLQDGRSRVRFLMGSLGFLIDLILLASLWSWF